LQFAKELSPIFFTDEGIVNVLIAVFSNAFESILSIPSDKFNVSILLHSENTDPAISFNDDGSVTILRFLHLEKA